VQRRNKRKHRYTLLECERAIHKLPRNLPDLPNLENLSVDEQQPFVINIFDPRELDNLDY
jgi:hypothetical protein